MPRLRLGTRGSLLARTQSQLVADLIEARGLAQVELVTIRTRGDELQSLPGGASSQLGVGLFTKALELALSNQEIDFAVHSLKDLPCAIDPEYAIAAIPPREDSSDAICGARLRELPPGARIGTGSPRRIALLKALRPDLQMIPIRGNIDTRLGRLKGPDRLEAVVLASSGLIRAGFSAAITERLSLLPAPGQGALALECRAADATTRAILAELDDPASRRGAEAERQLHLALGGGCLSPLGVLGETQATSLRLKAVVASLDGRSVLEASAQGENDLALVREVAAQLLTKGAAAVLEGARIEMERRGH